MRKFLYSTIAILVLGASVSSCGLFRGGKGDKCPAYSSVSTETESDLALSQEKASR